MSDPVIEQLRDSLNAFGAVTHTAQDAYATAIGVGVDCFDLEADTINTVAIVAGNRLVDFAITGEKIASYAQMEREEGLSQLSLDMSLTIAVAMADYQNDIARKVA